MPDSFTSIGSPSGVESGEAGAFALTFPLTVDLSTGHYGIPKGTTGRGGYPIVGICLHVLESTIETYSAYLKSVRSLADIRPGEHGSVHYAIEAGGAIHQFVADSNTAWAVPQLSNPTWALAGTYSGIQPDYLFLHIGVEKFISASMPTLMFRALAELCAKLCGDHSIAVDANHIISHTQLDDTFDDCADALATNLIATVQSLLADVGAGVSLDVSVIAAQLAALTNRVTTLETNFAASLATIATYAAHVTTRAGSSTLGHVESSSRVLVNPSTGVATVLQAVAAYKIVSGSQAIVPAIQAIVQFPTVVSDALSWGTLGVFQKVTPTIAGVYRMRARVQFAASDWSAAKTIALYCFQNGALLETLAVKTIEANLINKIVEISGECEFVVTLADYFDCRITTDDANGSKTIAAGNCIAEMVGA